MLAKKLSMSLIVVVVFLFIGQSALANENLTNVKTYTIDEDFDEGDLVEVNYDTPDQLQLNNITGTETTYSFVNVPATARGTIVRIDAESGVIIGEYRTAPAGDSASPSRTTVDSAGNVWVANQGKDFTVGDSVVKIGIVIGGTRATLNDDGTISDNPDGEYLKNPLYNTCNFQVVDEEIDDGSIVESILVRTSSGLGDILGWTETVGALDDCILLYHVLPDDAQNPQHVSVDADDDVWVGGYPVGWDLPGESGVPAMFYKLDGRTGAVAVDEDGDDIAFNAADIGCGGFGGLVDHNGILWSASQFQDSLLRYDPDDGSGECIAIMDSYGLAEFVIEQPDEHIPDDVFVFNSSKTLNEITKIDASVPPIEDPIEDEFSTGDGAEDRGLAVTGDGHIWVAKLMSGNDVVRRLDSEGVILSSITVGIDPTGLSVDAFGKVWVVNRGSSDVMRIDPDAGVPLPDEPPPGAVDLTVSLGTGAGSDAYSDMISNVTITTGTPGVSPRGTWTVIHDSGTQATEWETITCNTEDEGSVPDGAVITVEARASDTGPDAENQLEGDYTTVLINCGPPPQTDPSMTDQAPTEPSLAGQYIQFLVTMTPNSGGESPILSDLTVKSKSVEPEPEDLMCDVNGDKSIDIYDILPIFFTIGDTAKEGFDPRDWDKDTNITIIDARGCVQECTNNYCVAGK